MTGKELRKKLKRLFKKLDLDDVEIETFDIGRMYICNVNLDTLYEDKTLTNEERDLIWDNRKHYCIRFDKDKGSFYAEDLRHDRKNANRIY